MFEDFIKKIEELEKMKLSIPIDLDNDGYLDRECPNEDCLFIFKIKGEDWNSVIVNDIVYCPMCRHQAGKESWYTTEQIENGKEQGIAHVKSLFHNSLSDSARKFNARQPRNAFVSIKMTVTPKKPVHYLMPISAMDEMDLKVACSECRLNYSVIGSAFFCPCCGHNSADETFDNSMRKIKAKLSNIKLVRDAVAQVSKDDAETTCRSMIESSLNEIVVAFQRFCEVSFHKINPTTKLKFNAFQNLEVGGEYWREIFGESYRDWLSGSDFSNMNILFQKRHLLSHTEGIVDDKYIIKSGDASYKSGQRIVVKEKDVETLMTIVCNIIEKIRVLQTSGNNVRA